MKNIVAAIVAGIFGIGIVFGVNRCQDNNNSVERAAWKVEKHVADSLKDVAVADAYQAGLANAKSVPIYLAGRDRIIHDPANSPQTTTAVKACFEIADQRISACEASRKADSVAIAALQHDLKVADGRPEKKEKRLVLFGALGYSVTADSAGTRAAPAVRIGAENKLFGPLRLVTDVQLTMPASGHASPTLQGNIFGRINF